MSTITTNNVFHNSWSTDSIITETDLKQKAKNITKQVIGQMQTVTDRTKNFTSNLDAAKGLAVFGPPGVGKTEAVETALNDVKASWEPMKGATLSAIGFYYTLFFNKAKHRIILLDDFDLLNHPQATQIMTMLKVATESNSKPRIVKWTKQPTAYMIEQGIPSEFEFFGNIIWITNESPRTVVARKKLRTHVLPLVGPGGRFNSVVLDWTKEQKYYWTKYLIEKKAILGKQCRKKRGGYTKKIQKMVVDFFEDNLNQLIDVTPRFAANIADDILHFPKTWKQKAFQVNSFDPGTNNYF